MQWFGIALNSLGTTLVAISVSDDLPKETRKNVLKVQGAWWLAAGAHSLYNVDQGLQRKDIGYAVAASQALAAGLHLWRGFAEDDA